MTPGHVPVDVVYTWVDDTFPGYMDQLRRFARDGHDTNPNRTRDNLELIRYGLRSLEAFAPWVRSVTLVSMRPQVPAWLNIEHPDLRIVHHDEFMPPDVLPTFNSFAIVSQLHKLPIEAERFLYFEDDMLLCAPLTPRHLVEEDGRIRVYPRASRTPDVGVWDDDAQSPWNRAQAWTNRLLDEAYGPCPRRPSVGRVPVVIDREAFAAMWRRWPEDLGRSLNSRFRDTANAVPEHLYPYFLVAEGLGRRCGTWETHRYAGYHGIENLPLWNSLALALKTRQKPTVLTLNDNFGASPRPGVVAAIRAWLERRYPHPSRFERAN